MPISFSSCLQNLLKKSFAPVQYQDIYLQTKIVETFARIFEKKTIVLVKRTPSLGKTTLAYLLYQYYKNLGKPVFFIDGCHNISNSIIHLVDTCIMSGYHTATLNTLFY